MSKLEKIGYTALFAVLIAALVLVAGPLVIAGVNHQLCVLPKVWNGMRLGKAIAQC